MSFVSEEVARQRRRFQMRLVQLIINALPRNSQQYAGLTPYEHLAAAFDTMNGDDVREISQLELDDDKMRAFTLRYGGLLGTLQELSDRIFTQDGAEGFVSFITDLLLKGGVGDPASVADAVRKALPPNGRPPPVVALPAGAPSAPGLVIP